MRALLIIVLLFTSGCTTMDHNALVSPSESLYYKANDYYENKEFDGAIDYYTQFLEKQPRSEYATSASLNLGMSYYYKSDYKQAYTTLKDIKIKDENIKAYVDRIIAECEHQAGDAIKAEKETQLAASKGAETNGHIAINVTDAYVDDFGSVVLTGRTDITATVFVNGKKVTSNARNEFTATTSWKKGQPIPIAAKDNSGNTSELDYFPDGESPDEPEGLSVLNSGSNSIEIEWDDNPEDAIKGYRVFYRLKGGSTKEAPGIIKDNEYEAVGLETHVEGANRTFQFFVRAVDKMNNESDDSDILEADLP